jgi:hypothetical protein
MIPCHDKIRDYARKIAGKFFILRHPVQGIQLQQGHQ